MNEKFVIVSIDGGGVRGVIPAVILAELEQGLKKHTSEFASLVAGTSTGAILAGGIGMSIDDRPVHCAEEIVELYVNEVKEIFSNNKNTKRWWDFFRLTDTKYDSFGLIRVMRKYLRWRRISDTSVDVLTTAYDLLSNSIHIFSTWRGRELGEDFELLDAVVSSAVAPSFFDPHKTYFAGSDYAFVDGGAAGLNNPTLAAISEAYARGYKKEDIVVISLGTGFHEMDFSKKKTNRWGAIQWAAPVIKIQMDGSSEVAKMLAPQLVGDYFEINMPISKDLANMDNDSPKNMANLILCAKNYVKENRHEIQKIIAFMSDIVPIKRKK